ncbi:MAG: IS3 family transposase, partial [Solirubrobacteraceae bacterium]
MSAYIDCHRERFGVEPICQALDVSASAYYRRATCARSARDVEDERLLAVICATHKANWEAYGYRKTWKALLRAGESAPRCQVQRLMAANGIQGAKRRGKPWRTTVSDPAAERRADLVGRDFTAQAPNRLWVGDFTYLRCWEGRMFFAFILDVFSRMIVGWQLASHMRTDLVLDALRMALSIRAPGADFTLISHSDQGSQYTAEDYSQQLDDARVLASVGSVGDAYDNAMAESFVDTYKTELISDRVWRSRAQLELATVDWVGWYNHERLHESLGDIPPVEFEAAYAAITGDGSVAPLAPKPANGRRTRRLATVAVDLGVNSPLDVVNAPVARSQPNASSPSEALLTLNAARGVRPLRGRLRSSDSRQADWLT